MASTGTVGSDPAAAIYSGLNGTSTKTATSTVDASQSRFLTLLTTQLKNQDPLNPMDNAQVTSQLAQISTVDGIEKLNKTLQTLVDSSSESQSLQAAALVGHGVLISGSKLALGENGAVGGIENTEAVDRATVTIKDANGLTVRTLDLGALDAGTHNFVWDGKDDSGAAAATGNYTMSVSAVRGGANVSVSPLELGVVSSVTRGANGGVTLDMGSQGVVALADVKQIL